MHSVKTMSYVGEVMEKKPVIPYGKPLFIEHSSCILTKTYINHGIPHEL